MNLESREGGSKRPALPRTPGLRGPAYDAARPTWPTVSWLRNCRKLFSPTPRTFISSSTFLNGPFFWRYSTIRAAVLSAEARAEPSISAADAVLMLIFDGAGLFCTALAVAR